MICLQFLTNSLMAQPPPFRESVVIDINNNKYRIYVYFRHSAAPCSFAQNNHLES